MKKLLTRATTMYLISRGTTVCGDLHDGKIEVRKKPSGLYEITLYINGDPESLMFRSNYANFIKTMEFYHYVKFYEQDV